jgi:hypothetical protein
MNETNPNGSNDHFPAGHVIDEPELDRLTRRFSQLFSSLTNTNVGDLVGEVYADDAYLNDNLKEVRGIDEIREYLIESGQAVHSCRVRLDDLAQSKANYYVRWTMEIKFKSLKKGQVCRSQGISHLRFDQNGKITYHQDYWDSAGGLFEHIPVLGLLLRIVKRRL